MAEPDRLEQQEVGNSHQPERRDTSKSQKTSDSETKTPESAKEEKSSENVSGDTRNKTSETSPQSISLFEQIAFELLKDNKYPIEAAPGFNVEDLTPGRHEATRKDLTHILFRDRETGRGVAMMTTKSEGFDPNRDDYKHDTRDGFEIFSDPDTHEEVLRLPVVVGGAEQPPDLPPIEEEYQENIQNVRVVEFGRRATEQLKRAFAEGADISKLTQYVEEMAGYMRNFDTRTQQEKAQQPTDLTEAYYGFNISYAVQRWLREGENSVRNNIERLIASAEAYPDKEINQQLMQEMLSALTVVLKEHEQLREELRGKVEARYKIHNLNLISKYVDGEKRGPALTAMYANEPYDLIGTDGVYMALKLLEENDGDYFTERGRDKRSEGSLVDRQLKLIKAAKNTKVRKVKTSLEGDAKKDLEYNTGGFGYEFDGKEDGALAYLVENGERKSLGFTLGQVKEALKLMSEAREKDRVGVGPQTTAKMFFPQDEDKRKAFEQLLGKTRVAFDIAEKFAVGTGYAADHTRIVLKATNERGLGADDDRRVMVRYLKEVPLEIPQGWSGNVKIGVDEQGKDKTFVVTSGEKKNLKARLEGVAKTVLLIPQPKGEVINILEVQEIMRRYGTGEDIKNSNLSAGQKREMLRKIALLNAVIWRNSNLIPMAFATAKQKVMEEHWDEIDFNGSMHDDRSGREIGVEFWHNIRQEKESSRRVSIKGMGRWNDTAAVNLVDAAGFASMTDLLLGWNDVYNLAVRPMEKRARVNRRLHDQLVEDDPYLFAEVESLFQDPVKALEHIRKKAIGPDLHEEEADRLMGTYTDGVVYANKEMLDVTGGLFERKNSLAFAYMLADMAAKGVVSVKEGRKLRKKHIGSGPLSFLNLVFDSMDFGLGLLVGLKQFFSAAFSTK